MELSVVYNDKVELTKCKFEFTCKNCGRSWAVFLSRAGHLPTNSDVCVACASNETKKFIMRGNNESKKL